MPTRTPTAILLAGVLTGLLASCDGQPEGPPPASGSSVLMTIDGLEITFAEIEPFAEYFMSSHPESGRKTTVQTILQLHVVPLRLAERAFAERRKALRRKAQDLCDVVDNSMELEREIQNVEVYQRKKWTRLQPDIPVSKFLFDQLKLGSVSDPIPVPRGFVVATVHEYAEVALAGEDMVDATQVGFFTHTIAEWADWMREQEAALADKVTYVHPEYRDALPTWCRPPQPKN